MSAEEGIKYMKYVTENAKPGEAIYSYAAASLADITFKRGQIGNAAHTCLIALVADSSNEELRRLFVSFLQKHEQLVSAILEMFTNIEIPDSDSEQQTTSSISFVGGILMENSAITEAETFLQKSCELSKYKQPDLVLSYLHLMELSRDFSKLIIIANRYLETVPKKGISFTIPKDVFNKNKHLADILEKIESFEAYRGLVTKDKEENYTYKVTNRMFYQLFAEANKIIDQYLSTVNLQHERTGLQSNANVKVEKGFVLKTEENGNKGAESKKEEFDPFEVTNETFSIISVEGKVDALSQLAVLLAKTEIRNSVEYSEESLQLLAIYFTLLKVIYLICPVPQKSFPRAHGKDTIPQLLPLIAILEPIRIIGKDLHLTPVRNEQSYFTLISQLIGTKIVNRREFSEALFKTIKCKDHERKLEEELKDPKIDAVPERDFRTLVEDDFDKIYVFGDSHSLTLGWHLINKKALNDDTFDVNVDLKPTELLPVVAPGVKAWHLREESTYYPKYAFYQSVQFIQRHHKQFQARQEYLFENGNDLQKEKSEIERINSLRPKVILIFCEIDCREGMALAIETGKYGSVEEAARSVVDIYMMTISKLLKKYSFNCFVHPVLPLLEATRPLVNVFNTVLESEVKAFAKKSKMEENLVWLEFLSELTVEPEGGVKDEYKLDGTHVHPKYIEIFKHQLI